MLYLLPWTGRWDTGPLIGPAILLALENIRKNELIPGYDIEVHWRDTECEKLVGLKKTMDFWAHHGIDVIIGDGCSPVCIPVSMMASVWNIPMVSWGCSATSLSYHAVHDIFSRVVGPTTGRLMFYIKLLETFHWNVVGIISSTTDVHAYFSKTLFHELQFRNVTAVYHQTQTTNDQGYLNTEALNNLRNIMRSMRKRVRVIICFFYNSDIEQTIQLAHDEGMLEGYIYITFEYQIPRTSSMFNGMLILQLSFHTLNEYWQNFRAEVIKGFEDPTFKEMPGLSQQASVDEVSLDGGDYV